MRGEGREPGDMVGVHCGGVGTEAYGGGQWGREGRAEGVWGGGG